MSDTEPRYGDLYGPNIKPLKGKQSLSRMRKLWHTKRRMRR